MWAMLVLMFLLTAGQPVDGGQVELFDTDKERVVQTLPNSAQFQQTARSLLDSVSGRVQELNPPLNQAMIAKVPLEPPQQLRLPAARIDDEVILMFIVMPKNQASRKPYLILQTKDEKTLIVEFEEKVERLRRLLDL